VCACSDCNPLQGKVVVHKDYGVKLKGNDIALIILDEPIDSITPVKLAAASRVSRAPRPPSIGMHAAVTLPSAAVPSSSCMGATHTGSR